MSAEMLVAMTGCTPEEAEEALARSGDDLSKAANRLLDSSDASTIDTRRRDAHREEVEGWAETTKRVRTQMQQSLQASSSTAPVSVPALSVERLVGRRVRLWWALPEPGAWFAGIITEFSADKGNRLRYDDGVHRWHDLETEGVEQWELVPWPDGEPAYTSERDRPEWQRELLRQYRAARRTPSFRATAGKLGRTEEDFFLNGELGPCRLLSGGVLEGVAWQLHLAPPSSAAFGDEFSLAQPATRLERWSLAYAYMHPETRPTPTLLLPPALLLEAGTAAVLAIVIDGTSEASSLPAAERLDAAWLRERARRVDELVRTRPLCERHPLGARESTFLCSGEQARAAPLEASKKLELPGGFGVYPQAGAASRAVQRATDAAGAARMPCLHLALRRCARGAPDSLPAWLKDPSNAQSVSELQEVATTAGKLAARALPRLVEMQRETLHAAALSDSDVTGCAGLTEMYVSAAYFAAPHVERDRVIGFQMLVSATTEPPSATDSLSLRDWSVLALPSSRHDVALPHGAVIWWRPASGPHFQTAPRTPSQSFVHVSFGMQMQEDVVLSSQARAAANHGSSSAWPWPSRQLKAERALVAARSHHPPLRPEPGLRERVCAAFGWKP